MSGQDTEPLLRDDRRELADGAAQHQDPPDEPRVQRIRLAVQRFLTSRVGHYAILLMVSLDVTCIFGDIFISLFTCGREKEPQPDRAAWEVARGVLGNISLVFSVLFMLELLASVWAFGLLYFRPWFHCFDAAVIAVGFVVDVLLHGVVEEVASLVVILRLWRIFKIVEEFSVGAKEEMNALSEKIERLENENRDLKKELHALQAGRREGVDWT
ncbi:MAG: hypothetical protein M1840_001481 [Geoglossum simile]|nr:MAG: hypothetical protein M1840_001481 [Geoglossum simile]